MADRKPSRSDIDRSFRNERLYRNRVMKDYAPTSGSIEGFSYGANSVTGWRVAQEDRYKCLPAPNFTESWSFFAIYDGHGGEDVADFLKKKLHGYMLKKLREYGDIKIALDEGFKECDRALKAVEGLDFFDIQESVIKELLSQVKYEFYKRIIQLHSAHRRVPFESDDDDEASMDDPVASGTRSKKPKIRNEKRTSVLEDMKIEFDGPLVGYTCGSTATVVVFTEAIIYAANVGDSRCIASINGDVQALSQDHRPLNRKEQRRILAAGHKIIRGRVDGGLNMSRAFGDFGLKDRFDLKQVDQAVNAQPSLFCIEINDDLDFIVIASDGIWNNMGNAEVAQFVSQNLHLPLPDICAMIFEHILSNTTMRQGQDNMSMIIIKNDSKSKITIKQEIDEVETKAPLMDIKDIKTEGEPMKDVKKEREPMKDVKKEREPMKDVKKEREPMKDVKKEREPMKDVKKEREPMKDVKKEREESELETRKVKRFKK